MGDEGHEDDEQFVGSLADAPDDGFDLARTVDRGPVEGCELKGTFEPVSIRLARI